MYERRKGFQGVYFKKMPIGQEQELTERSECRPDGAQEIEVASVLGLHDALLIKPAVAPRG
jgi:hypothetical protein